MKNIEKSEQHTQVLACETNSQVNLDDFWEIGYNDDDR